MSQVLGTFGLLDFTVLRSVLAWLVFLTLRTVYFFNFPFFSGRGEPQVLNQWIWGHICIFSRLISAPVQLKSHCQHVIRQRSVFIGEDTYG
jgi:hypothetical protein